MQSIEKQGGVVVILRRHALIIEKNTARYQYVANRASRKYRRRDVYYVKNTLPEIFSIKEENL